MTENQTISQNNVLYSPEGGFNTGSEVDNQRLRRFAQIFSELVTIPSETNSDMHLILDYLQAFYRNLHAETKIIGEYEGLVAMIPGKNNSDAPRFIGAHVDTVGAVDVDPYIDTSTEIPTFRSHGTSGLGADDKAAIAEILVATEEILASGIDHVSMIHGFTIDEEDQAESIKKIPTLGAEFGLILDREGEPLGRGIVTRGYGYHRFDVALPQLQGNQSLEFITRFSERVGSRLVGRRVMQVNGANTFLHEAWIDICSFVIKKTNQNEKISRNTVPSYAEITGSLNGKNVAGSLLLLQEHITLLGGTIIIDENQDNSLDFRITFLGIGGHPSRDDLATPLTNMEAFGRTLLESSPEEQILPDRRNVRYSIAHVEPDKVIGEVRYQLEDEQETEETLHLLQTFVEEFGGTMTYAQENRAYSYPDNHPGLQVLDTIFGDMGVEPTHVTSFGVSDANNADIALFVIPEGSENVHNKDNDEYFPIYRALSAMEVIRRLYTTQIVCNE